MQGAGQTPGGIPSFLIGFILCISSSWLLMDQVHVTTGYHGFFGSRIGFGSGTFAVVMLPFVLGVLFMFFLGPKKWTFALVGLGLVLIALEIASSLRFRFDMKLSLVMMLCFFVFAGLGLMLRSMKTLPPDISTLP